MTKMTVRRTREELLHDLTVRAEAVLGKERAALITAALEQTARQLAEISAPLPERDIEPGFYQ
jgi:hypothetical protein